MRVLLGFAPFLAFALSVQVAPLWGACLVASGVGLAMVLRDSWLPGRSVKIVEAGAALLYGGMAIVTTLHPGLPMGAVWIANDAGLLLIAVVSVAVGLPFTLQYARERVAPEFWGHPVFVRVNVHLTAAWAGAFLVMLLAQVASSYLPGIPRWADTAASIAASAGALWFPAGFRRTSGAPTPFGRRKRHRPRNPALSYDRVPVDVLVSDTQAMVRCRTWLSGSRCRRGPCP